MRRKGRKKIRGHKIPYRLIIIGIICCLFVGYLIYFVISFFSVKTVNKAAENASDRYLLTDDSKESTKTLIVIENGTGSERKITDAYVLITNFSKNKTLLIYLPGWLYYTGLEENFGTAIPVSSFRYAGDKLKEGRGIEYAVWQIGQVLGVKFNNYIYLSSEALDAFDELFGTKDYSQDRYRDMYSDVFSDPFFQLHKLSTRVSLFKSIFNPQKLKFLNGNIYSNMSFSSIFNFLVGINSDIKNTDASGIDLSSYIYSEEEFVETGGQRRYIDLNKFDNEYRSIISSLLDKELEKERVRVEVYNGSGVSGAAMQLGRKIENSGCDVIRYENAPEVEEKTLLYISQKENFPKSLSTVSSILSEYFVLIEGRPSFMTTGDIVIILGEDIKLVYSF